MDSRNLLPPPSPKNQTEMDGGQAIESILKRNGWQLAVERHFERPLRNGWLLASIPRRQRDPQIPHFAAVSTAFPRIKGGI